MSILTFSRLWCGRRRVTMLFVVTPERVSVEGETGSVATDSDLRAYVGIALDGDAFLHQQNPFARRNVTAIVLEVPSELIGKGKINAWATISLFGHAPEVQVSRWGLPVVTHLFLNDPSDQEVKEQFNASIPSEDLERFAKSIADFAEKMTTYAGSAADPGEYGKLIAARLCPDTLPYELGTSAAFEVASFNGRALGDDALDVMLTLATNTPLVDGLAPHEPENAWCVSFYHGTNWASIPPDPTRFLGESQTRSPANSLRCRKPRFCAGRDRPHVPRCRARRTPALAFKSDCIGRSRTSK